MKATGATAIVTPNRKIQLYLGTMTFGWTSQTSSPVDQLVANEMLQKFVCSNHDAFNDTCCYIDTARIYAGGKTEQLLGRAIDGCLTSQSSSSGRRLKLRLGTKAHPSQPGGLSKTGILNQLEASLNALNMNLPSHRDVCHRHYQKKRENNNDQEEVAIHEYYLHQPDTENSLLESLTCLDELVRKGMIERVGMSNYAASEMERAFQLCEEHNLTKPVVYQGLYNPLNRLSEEDLLPILRRNDCAFVAYNPLAAGLLTGKHDENDDSVLKGRFFKNPNYLPRFYTAPNFRAIEIIREACASENISIVEATYKWLMLHSSLDGDRGDGLLIGASSTTQLDSNLKACNHAEQELSQSILKAFDDAWVIIQNDGDHDVFKYWRSFSFDMPGRDNLDHGASYNANKVAK